MMVPSDSDEVQSVEDDSLQQMSQSGSTAISCAFETVLLLNLKARKHQIS